MREIKFRCWDKKNNLMIYFNPIKTTYTNDSWDSENNYRIESSRNYDFKETCYNHDDFNVKIETEIMQYTGLKDKNGKDIYEGEICLIEQEKYVVKWDNDNAGFYFENILSVNDCRDFGDNDYEVIGNIYENQELLK